jgi:hypothetical protein
MIAPTAIPVARSSVNFRPSKNENITPQTIPSGKPFANKQMNLKLTGTIAKSNKAK